MNALRASNGSKTMPDIGTVRHFPDRCKIVANGSIDHSRGEYFSHTSQEIGAGEEGTRRGSASRTKGRNEYEAATLIRSLQGGCLETTGWKYDSDTVIKDSGITRWRKRGLLLEPRRPVVQQLGKNLTPNIAFVLRIQRESRASANSIFRQMNSPQPRMTSHASKKYTFQTL
jgi:hypothetical protein